MSENLDHTSHKRSLPPTKHNLRDLGRDNANRTTQCTYRWKLPEGFNFSGQGEPRITFVTGEKEGFGEVHVSVEIDGLPKNCPNSASTTFHVFFNPGSPLVFDEFADLDPRDEAGRLGATLASLETLPNHRAVFVISYRPTDSKRYLRSRVRILSNVLKMKYKLPDHRYTFVFSESDPRSTTIYAWGIDLPLNDYWATDIDKLVIRN